MQKTITLVTFNVKQFLLAYDLIILSHISINSQKAEDKWYGNDFIEKRKDLRLLFKRRIFSQQKLAKKGTTLTQMACAMLVCLAASTKIQKS